MRQLTFEAILRDIAFEGYAYIPDRLAVEFIAKMQIPLRVEKRGDGEYTRVELINE
jgi:hypothetical protein